MFAISERVSPCRARSSPRSLGRVTVTEPSACSIFIRAGTCWLSSPSGPLTITRPGESATETLVGSWMGCLPIRLICSPDEADDLAADAALGRCAARDQAVGGGQNRDAHAAEHPREAVLAGVDAAAGLGDALQVGDHALPVAAELELDDERVIVHLGPALHPVVTDVALLLEQPCDL